jgi:hypothetical protein
LLIAFLDSYRDSCIGRCLRHRSLPDGLALELQGVAATSSQAPENSGKAIAAARGSANLGEFRALRILAFPLHALCVPISVTLCKLQAVEFFFPNVQL